MKKKVTISKKLSLDKQTVSRLSEEQGRPSKALKQFQSAQLDRHPFTYCLVGPEKLLAMDGITAFGALTRLTPEQIFGY